MILLRKASNKGLNQLKCLILPLVVYLIFAVGSGFRFGKPATMFAILRQTVLPTLIAWAISSNQTMGVWDFTPGSVICLSGIIGGNIALKLGTNCIGLMFILIACTIVLSMVMFVLFNFLRIPSMVTGLGVLMMYETLSALLFNGGGVAIRGDILRCLAHGIGAVTRGDISILGRSPYIFIVFIVGGLIIWTLNNKTKFGYNVRALGYGTAIAQNIGVNLTKTRFFSFLLEGVMLGLASTVSLSMTGNAAATLNMATTSMGFDAIMGVFIGQYLAKYCDITIGIALGAFTMKMLGSGLLAFGLSSTLQQVATGLFLLLFIGISQNQNVVFEKRALRKKAAEALAKQQ